MELAPDALDALTQDEVDHLTSGLHDTLNRLGLGFFSSHRRTQELVVFSVFSKINPKHNIGGQLVDIHCVEYAL